MKKNEPLVIKPGRVIGITLAYANRKEGERPYILRTDTSIPIIEALADIRWVNLFLYPELQGPKSRLITVLGDDKEVADHV